MSLFELDKVKMTLVVGDYLLTIGSSVSVALIKYRKIKFTYARVFWVFFFFKPQTFLLLLVNVRCYPGNEILSQYKNILILFVCFINYFIVVQLQLSAFSPCHFPLPQPNPPPCLASILPLGFVHVFFIVGHMWV